MNTSFIDIFFRLFNFAIFIAVIVYYVRKNILGYLQTQVLRKKAYSDDLTQKKASLEQTRCLLLEHLKNQDALYNQLDHKVALWQAAAEQHKQLSTKKHAYHYSQLLKRLNKQLDSYKEYQVKQRLVPKVFDSTRRSLTLLFKDEKKSYAYNEHALNALKNVSELQ